MDILCFIVDPFLGVAQQIVNIAWFPLSFLGLSAPSVGSFIAPILGCTS